MYAYTEYTEQTQQTQRDIEKVLSVEFTGVAGNKMNGKPEKSENYKSKQT